MKQLGLVTHYGPKPLHFKNLIEQCQGFVVESLGSDFIPYKVEQVHGTIISLERLDEHQLYNLQSYITNKRKLEMDVIGYLEYLRNTVKFPIVVQVGGFKRDDVAFLSLGRSPYERSFSFQGIKAVLIGWPVARYEAGSKDTKFSDILGRVRTAGERFNLRHTYNRPDFVDTEYYFRLGLLKEEAKRSNCQAAEDRVREYLSSHEPTIIEVSITDMSVVCYVDDTLPTSSTKRLPLSSISTNEDIKRLLL